MLYTCITSIHFQINFILVTNILSSQNTFSSNITLSFSRFLPSQDLTFSIVKKKIWCSPTKPFISQDFTLTHISQSAHLLLLSVLSPSFIFYWTPPALLSLYLTHSLTLLSLSLSLLFVVSPSLTQPLISVSLTPLSRLHLSFSNLSSSPSFHMDTGALNLCSLFPSPLQFFFFSRSIVHEIIIPQIETKVRWFFSFF